MSKPVLSVVIPTHKRAKLLQIALEHLAVQTIAEQLEVIVVSDGEDAETEQLFDDIRAGKTELGTLGSIACMTIPKSQQGVARNKGVENATAPLVLFLQDDAFAAPDACEKHVAMHKKYDGDIAVLGFTTWDPACDITPVMNWLENTGWQFAYPLLEKYAGTFVPKWIQHRVTYTIHLSIPTHIARSIPFREDVTLYGWEDIEWGERLRDAGTGLVYEPQATVLHHHHLELSDSLKRIETLGRSSAKMKQLDPTFDRYPKGWKRLAYQCLALLPTMRGWHAKAFLKGLNNG